jgi:GNAT superfamily N-acetyltransferase
VPWTWAEPRTDLVQSGPLAYYITGRPRSDRGVIAEASGVPIGAAWLRLMPADDPGYAFVAPDVPELSIGVITAWRGRGVSRALLRAAAAQARAHGAARISSNTSHPISGMCGRPPPGHGTDVTPVPAIPANSADGGAEPRGQLVEQILLVVTGPGHVAVWPQ